MLNKITKLKLICIYCIMCLFALFRSVMVDQVNTRGGFFYLFFYQSDTLVCYFCGSYIKHLYRAGCFFILGFNNCSFWSTGGSKIVTEC